MDTNVKIVLDTEEIKQAILDYASSNSDVEFNMDSAIVSIETCNKITATIEASS